MLEQKLTPRQLAASKNRAMRGPLCDDARERLREAAKVNRPWLAATGPRTVRGKQRSRSNALRHGGCAELLTPPAVHEAESLRREGLPLDPATGWEAIAWLNDTGTMRGLSRAMRIAVAMGEPKRMP